MGVLHVRNYSTQALQIWPLNVQKILVVHFSTTVCFSNDSVHTALLARDEMFKVTWVQMSQSVGECLKRLSHCIPFLQAQFHQYQRGGGSTYQSYFNKKKKNKQKAQPSRTIIFLIFVWWYFHWRRTNTKVFCFFPQEGHEQVVSPEKAEILQCVQQNTRDFLSVGRQQTKQTNLEGHLCDTSWTR